MRIYPPEKLLPWSPLRFVKKRYVQSGGFLPIANSIPQAAISRMGTPTQLSTTAQPESSENVAATDDSRLRQLAMMLTDVNVVVERVLLLWQEEIGLYLEQSEDEPLEGAILYELLVFL